MIICSDNLSMCNTHTAYCVFSDTNLLLCVCLLGVTVLAVGINQADTEELRRVVTDGSTQNILYVRDAAQLNTLHTDLADLLCGIARIPEVRRNLESLALLVYNSHNND